MSSNPETERVDMLLALALTFGEAGAADATEESASASVSEESGGADALASLSALAPGERHAVARRAEWFAKLPPQKQRAWVAHMLGRARGRLPRFDERLHPSHVAEQLREEPPRVRELVLSYLPGRVAEDVAARLGVARRAQGSSSPVAPEVVAVVRREFLSRFEPPPDPSGARPLDMFSGAVLARLVRLLGVRETAVACRGIEAVEAVASFLRRFEPEDARAIAAHIASLSEVSPARVRFAEQVTRDALLSESESGSMLDLVGLRLLANSFGAGADSSRLRYAAQKLPVEAARLLSEMAREGLARFVDGEDGSGETRRAIARETAAVAAGLYESQRRQPRRAAAADGGGAAVEE
jgi:hypothetical protein